MNAILRCAGSLCLLGVLTPTIWSGDEATALFARLPLGKQAPVVHDPDLLSRALRDIARDPWKPGVNEEKARGVGADVYAAAAPAVVVIKTDKGHGTGAFVDPAGWVITNHHVIANASVDRDTGALQATVFLGKIKDGFMELDKNGLPALVYKTSPEKDLALLRIHLAKNDNRGFHALKIAKEVPAAGKTCVSIGHPGSGLLWTVRTGEVSGIGKWPTDMTELLTSRLSASPRERQEFDRLLGKVTQRKIVLSNCGINFGDSGGPLLNAQGELIAVTFAMPKKGYEGTAPFAYHVHLDEVKEFLKDRPAQPAVAIPDAWPAGFYHELSDLDGDGTAETLSIGNGRGSPANGMLFDLRQENKARTIADLGGTPRDKWRFCLAVHFSPRLMAFYDTDFDGKIDLILSEKEPRGDIHAWSFSKGRWNSEYRSPRPLIDPAFLTNQQARDRLARILQRLRPK